MPAPVADPDLIVSWSVVALDAVQLRSYASQVLAIVANHHPV